MCYEYEWMIWEDETPEQEHQKAKPKTADITASPQPVQPKPATETQKPLPVEADLEPV